MHNQPFVTLSNLDAIRAELREMGLKTVPLDPPVQNIPDQNLYQRYVGGAAVFSPWTDHPLLNHVVTRLADQGLMTLVNYDRLWVLMSAFHQTKGLPGEVWETGVYQGGSGYLLKLLIEEQEQSASSTSISHTMLRLFDSFQGLPQHTLGIDTHQLGQFANTSLERVREFVGEAPWVDFRAGWIPATFEGLESSPIRLAHVDVDLYRPIRECCEFIYPRLAPGGMIVFDDYGTSSCPGARKAVDEYFGALPESPLVLATGQCLVIKLPG